MTQFSNYLRFTSQENDLLVEKMLYNPSSVIPDMIDLLIFSDAEGIILDFKIKHEHSNRYQVFIELLSMEIEKLFLGLHVVS